MLSNRLEKIKMSKIIILIIYYKSINKQKIIKRKILNYHITIKKIELLSIIDQTICEIIFKSEQQWNSMELIDFNY